MRPAQHTLAWSKSSKRDLSKRLRAIKPFDPYHCALCTCPPKLTLNVYTGCGMECFYCYTSSYARGRWGRESVWGPRKDVLAGVQHDLALIAEAGEPLGAMPVVLSLSSDPYPDTPLVKECELRLTRRCLELISAANMGIIIQTKSDMVVRDLDVLPPERTLIGMTITTADADLATRIEPYAPPPERRIAALAEAARRGFPTLCRIDPLMPKVNDQPKSLDRLVTLLRDAGVKQVVSSTFKKRWDSSRRFESILPRQAAATADLYLPDQLQGYNYLKEEFRRSLMERLRDIAHRHGLAFSCCREGFPDLNDVCCDGRSWWNIPLPERS